MNKCNALLSFITPLVFSFNVLAQQDYYENALQAFNKDDIDSAFIHIKNALQNDPNNLAAKLLLSEIFIEQQAYQLAEQELLDAIDQGVDINLIVEPLGESLLLQGKFEQALTFVDKKQLSRQANLAATLVKAKASQALEKFDQAELIYKKIIVTAPKNIEANLGLTSIYLYLENIEQAEKSLAIASDFSKNSSRYWRLKGVLATISNTPEQALVFFNKANDIEPNNFATYRGIANSHITLEQYSQAEVFINKMLDIAPKDPQAQLMKSSILRKLENHAVADQVLTQLTNQLSTIDEAYLHSKPQLLLIDSMTSYRQKNWEQARKKFHVYLEQKPKDINAIILLADSYTQLKQNKKALDLLADNELLVLKNKDHSLILAELYIEFNQYFRADYLLSELRKKYEMDVDILILSAKILSKTGQLKKAISLLEQQKNINSSRFKHSLAILYYQSGQLGQSLDIVTNIIKVAPENINFQLLHSQILIKLKRFDEATTVITKVYKENPNNPQAKVNYGKLLLNLNKNQEAKETFKSLVKDHNENGEYWLELAKIEFILGDAEAAIAILKRQTKNALVQESAQLKLAHIYFTQRQFEQSLSVLKKVLKNDRLSSTALTLKFKNLQALGRAEEAKRQISILQGLWHNNAKRLLQLSEMQQQIAEYESAEHNLKRALDIAPSSIAISTEAIKLKTFLGKFNDALLLISSLEKRAESNKTLLLILKGDVYSAQKKFNRAFTLYEQALKADNSNTTALIKLNKISNLPPRADKFTRLLSELVKQYPERAFQQNMFANILLQHKEFNKAKFQYQQLLTKKLPRQERAFALNNLANIYIEEQDYVSAVTFAKDALKMSTTSASIIDTVGWALTLSGIPKEGLTHLRKAYTMSASSPEIQYHIAYTLALLDRNPEAKKILEKLTSMPNRFTEYDLAISLLNQLNSASE